MRIFVTGATGFIGSHFLNRIQASNHEIIALRRTLESNTRIPLVVEPLWISSDIGAIDTADLQGVDCLVHLAAHGGLPPHDTLQNCIHWNVEVPLELFRKAFRSGVKRFVVTGSCFEYGRTGEKVDFLRPEDPLEPVGAYAISKAMATQAFRELAQELGLYIMLLRPFHTYGEGEDESRLWPSLRKASMSGADYPMTLGEQVRDFTPVELVASALVDASVSNRSDPGRLEIHNIGTGCPQTVLEFANYWWQRWKSKGKLNVGALPYRDGEVMRFVPEILQRECSRQATPEHI